jgi:hypothetical protein
MMGGVGGAATAGVLQALKHQCVKDQVRGGVPDAKVSEAWLALLAAAAEKYGCGNCMEQSAIAWQFLKKKDARPLDLIAAVDKDHAFLVIGRAADSDPRIPATWGNVAVVCDPWWPVKHHRAYGTADMAARMFPKARFESWLRVA